MTLTAFCMAFMVYLLLVGLPTEQLPAFGWVWLATVAWNPQLGLRGHLRFVRDWGPLLLTLLLYDYSRGLAHALGAPVHVQPQISADQALFGVVPTLWLQTHLWDPAQVRWYDVAASFIYFSHFVASLGTATVLWLTNRRHWARFVRRLIALSAAGLTGYLLYPAAPPWLAAQTGQLSGPVARLSGRGWAAIGLHSAGDVIERGQAFANPVAAMPSLHAGFALLVVAFFLPQVRRRYWPLLLSYPLLMAATLVYTGEHYVIDIVAGWFTVALAYLVVAGMERGWSRCQTRPDGTG